MDAADLFYFCLSGGIDFPAKLQNGTVRVIVFLALIPCYSPALS